MTLEKKIKSAINLLQSIPQDGPIEVSYSGGKDSDVILQLAKEAGIPFEAIYKNTTIDPPGTIAHCKANGVRIVRPVKPFFKIVEEKGFPSRWQRFCCEVLKEYKIHDRAIQGIRRCESTKRATRYKEPEVCRVYPKGGKVRVYLPILEWSNEDVAEFIKDRGIKCAPAYYDENGQFHIERRLGCIGCPLASQRLRREAYKKFPGILRESIKALQRFYNLHPQTVGAKMFNGNAYDKFVTDLFYDCPRQFLEAQRGMFGAEDSKQFLMDYFNFEL